MLFYKDFINIAYVFVSLKANFLPAWEMVCLFLLKMGRLVFVRVGNYLQMCHGTFYNAFMQCSFDP